MIGASLVSVWVAVPLLVLGMVFMTLAEIWQSAGAWTLSYAFAPAAARVQYLAIFGLSGLLAQDVIGPSLLGGVMIDIGTLGWLALAVVFLVSIPLLTPIISSLSRRQQADAERALEVAPEPASEPGEAVPPR
jgi:hypothetical protein